MWREETGFLEMFLAYFHLYAKDRTGSKIYRDFLYDVLSAHEKTLKPDASTPLTLVVDSVRTVVSSDAPSESPVTKLTEPELKMDQLNEALVNSLLELKSALCDTSLKDFDIGKIEPTASDHPKTEPLTLSSGPAASPCKSEKCVDLSEWVKRECDEDVQVTDDYDCDLDAAEVKAEPEASDCIEVSAPNTIASSPSPSPCKSNLSLDLMEWIKIECAEDMRVLSDDYDCDLDAAEPKAEPEAEPVPTEDKEQQTAKASSQGSAEVTQLCVKPEPCQAAVEDRGDAEEGGSPEPPSSPALSPSGSATSTTAARPRALRIRIVQTNVSSLRRFFCSICGRAFRKNYTLQLHKLTHRRVRPFACEICDKAFKTHVHLNKHKRNHSRQRSFVCSHCSKSYFTNYELRQHERTHTGEKPFECHLCDKAFHAKSLLTVHLRTHSGEKRFSCYVCSQRFARPDSMRHHCLRLHDVTRPFRCEPCSATFERLSALRMHEQDEGCGQLKKCYSCELTFAKEADFVAHRHECAARLYYPCSVCGKVMKTARQRRYHEQTHSTVRHFECQLCLKRFALKSYLRKHARRVHANFVSRDSL